MTSSPSAASRSTRHAWSWTILWLVPPLLVLVAIVTRGIYQYMEHQWITAYRLQLEETGELLTPEQQTQRFYDTSTTVGLVEWLELSRSLSVAFNQRTISAWLAVQQADSSSAPRSLALDETEVERWLSDMSPLLDRLDTLLQSPRPIWVPHVFAPQQPRYMAAIDLGAVRQYLELEILLRIQQADRPRILQAFERLERLETVELHYTFGGSLYSLVYMNNTRLKLLTVCLTVPGWTDEELARLRQWTQPSADVARLWREEMRNSKLLALEEHWHYLSVPDLPWLNSFLGLTSTVRAGLIRRKEQVNREPQWDQPERLTRELAEFDAAGEASSLEYERRWQRKWLEWVANARLVNTGLAIRQFKLKFGVWPTQLAELAQIGLKSSDWRAPNGFEFGYQVSYPPLDSPAIWFSRSPSSQTNDTARFNPKTEPAESYNYGHTPINDETPATARQSINN